jgi:undecaprenyl-diphosphatase
MRHPLITGTSLIALTLLLGIAVSAGFGSAQDQLVGAAIGMRTGETPPGAITLWQLVSWSGGGIQRYIIVALLALFLAVRYHWRLGLILAVTALASNLTSNALKLMFGRVRPDLVPHLDHAASFAFPSGHATSAALVYLLFALLIPTQRRRLWITVAVVMMFLTGLSRIMLGVHWTSDVLGGWLLGVGFAALGLGMARRWGPAR